MTTTTFLPPPTGPEKSLQVALLMPDIPQNTGNIARLCLATGSHLILVRPLGFRLTDSQLHRAGMDYWEQLSPTVFDTLDEFLEWGRQRTLYFFSSHGRNPWTAPAYQPGDVICFGSESSGFPQEIREDADKQGRLLTLPMVQGVRCLNVSSSAAAVVYEALRQLHGF